MAFPNFLAMDPRFASGIMPEGVPAIMPGEHDMIKPRVAFPNAGRRGGGFRNVLGMIGDALLIGAGRNPIYRPELQRRQGAEALAGYFDDPQTAIENYLAIDPENGIRLLTAHLTNQRELAQAKRGGEPTTFQREVEYLRSIGRDDLAERRIQREAEGAPIVQRNDDGTITVYPQSMLGGAMGQSEGGEDIPTVSTPEEARRLPPGSRFRNPQGEILTVPGGPTPSASGNFP